MFLLWLCLISAPILQAQSVNPLNYSGTLYVSSMEELSTPRYVSYEEHAILTPGISMPVIEVTKVVLDFENGYIRFKDNKIRVRVTAAKKYVERNETTVVIYLDMLEGTDKIEVVWPGHGRPYMQQISYDSSGVEIARMYLTNRPTATDPYDALNQMLNGYGY